MQKAGLEKCTLLPSPCRATSAIQIVRRTFREIPIPLCLVIAAGCFFIATANGQQSPQVPSSRDISELAPEDLMKLTVTSAANKEEPLSKVGAALYVITREDIASSGANNIQDLLRLCGVWRWRRSMPINGPSVSADSIRFIRTRFWRRSTDAHCTNRRSSETAPWICRICRLKISNASR